MKISEHVYSIDGLEIIPYILVESDHDLTLIDTFYLRELLERDLNNIGCEMKVIKRIVLTHLHSDHSQTANEVKNRISSSSGQAEIFAYWIDAAYLAHNSLYPGPPDSKIYEKLFQR